MKHLLAAAMLLVPLPASAQITQQRIDAMVARCEAEMVPGAEVCRVFRDKKSYGSQTTIPTAYGRISVDAYLRIRNAKEQMCILGRAACALDPHGDECKAALILWPQP